jgi:transcriptional regulator with XRE-family HTH domain
MIRLPDIRARANQRRVSKLVDWIAIAAKKKRRAPRPAIVSQAIAVVGKKTLMNQDRPAADFDAVIGERVRSRRIAARISQAGLAEALGVTLQQVEEYEQGTDRIGYGRLFKIAEVLGCDVMGFFEGIAKAETSWSTPVSKFVATQDGVALIEAMLKIKKQALRRTVIDIAEKLAEN